MIWDVIISGAGPAGAACAAFASMAGLKVLVLERAEFPRDKVCGDCLNPLCWPVLERLGAAAEIVALPHSKPGAVEIVTLDGTTYRHPLAAKERGEISVKRSRFDAVIARRAATAGATVRHGVSITHVERKPDAGGWVVRDSRNGVHAGRRLVAADGRNSTVARLLHLLPATARERVATQTQLPAPPGFGEKVMLRLLPWGYCGVASVGEGAINLCLVGRPADVPALRAWAGKEFGMTEPALKSGWRLVTPLARPPLPPLGGGGTEGSGLVLAGDAARVVEPFTGEGIYYALASGELAAAHLTGRLSAPEFRQAHRRLYAGRLWINRLAKLAVLHPRSASALLGIMGGTSPRLLGMLTGKVVG